MLTVNKQAAQALSESTSCTHKPYERLLNPHKIIARVRRTSNTHVIVLMYTYYFLLLPAGTTPREMGATIFESTDDSSAYVTRFTVDKTIEKVSGAVQVMGARAQTQQSRYFLVKHHREQS